MIGRRIDLPRWSDTDTDDVVLSMLQEVQYLSCKTSSESAHEIDTPPAASGYTASKPSHAKPNRLGKSIVDILVVIMKNQIFDKVSVISRCMTRTIGFARPSWFDAFPKFIKKCVSFEQNPPLKVNSSRITDSLLAESMVHLAWDKKLGEGPKNEQVKTPLVFDEE